MLLQIKIGPDGYGFQEGTFEFIKLISSVTPVRVTATDGGSPILNSDMRAPMAVPLGRRATRLEIYSKTPQTVEVWAGLMPLEYMQLTAVGGSNIKTTEVGLTAGTLQKLLDAKPRKKVLVKTTTPIRVKSNPLEAGWPLGENGEIELELTGPLYAQKAASTFISAAAEHALVDPENYFVDVNTAVVFYRKMANGDRIVQRYRESLTIYLAAGGEISGWGFACDDPKTGHVYCLFAPLDSETAAKAKVYRHTGDQLAYLLETTTAIKCNKDTLSYGADNALYMSGWFAGNKVIRIDLITAAITTFASSDGISNCTCAIDGFIYWVSDNTLMKRQGMTGTDSVVIAGLPQSSGAQSRSYQDVLLVRAAGSTTKTSKIINLLTLAVSDVLEPSSIGNSNRYATLYNGVDWFMGFGDGRLLRVQNNTIEVVGGAIDNAGAEKCAFVGYDYVQDKIVVGVSPADSEIKAASVDVVVLGDSRPAIVSTLETFI